MDNVYMMKDALVRKSKEIIDKNNKDKNSTQEEIITCDERFVSSWIMGYPLLTEYGYIKPIKVKEFWGVLESLEFLKLQDWQVKNQILRFVKKNMPDKFDSVKDDFDKFDFMTCVRNNVMGLRTEYTKTFSSLIDNFNEKSLWTMGFSDWNKLRRLILDFNDVYYREANPNPKIERYNKMKDYMNSQKGSTIEFDAMYSLLMTKEGGGHQPSEINEWTYRQFSSAFKRIQFTKAHEVTTLFKTVDTKDSIDIVEYYKTFREEETEVLYGSVDEIKRTNVFMANKKGTKKGDYEYKYESIAPKNTDDIENILKK